MMPMRKLGRQGLEVSMIGLGCMGMSQSYGAADEKESVATLLRALDLGCNFLDTAERARRVTSTCVRSGRQMSASA
jgi:aryl-alcohol dehydrogenase-like predicted oxidoreductase